MLYEIECQCAGGALSPGQSGCMPQVSRDKFPIFMHYKDSDGNLNGIPAGTVLDEAWLTAKLNETDETVKWWVFPEFEELASPPPTAETQEIGGKAIPTGEELKQPTTWEHYGSKANPALKAAYDSIKCEEIGVIFGTFKGQLNGMNDGLGNLVSIKLQKDSLTAQYAPPIKGQVQKLMCSMIIDELENDANRDYIESSKIAYPVKDWFAKQPIEIVPVVVLLSNTIDGVELNLNQLYGGVGMKKPIEGVLSSWFSNDLGSTTAKVYNKTTSASIAVVATEGDPGKYALVYGTSQAQDDVMVIEIFQSGYHMRTLEVTCAYLS